MFGKLNKRDALLVSLLLLIATVIVGASWWGGQEIEKRLVLQQARANALRWGTFVRENLSDPAATFAYGKITEEDQELIATIAQAGNVFRYKFFNKDGIIVLASRLDDLGQKNTKPYFQGVVAQGRPFAKVEKKKSVRELQPTAALGDQHSSEISQDELGRDGGAGGERFATISEAYVPVMEGGRFLGAIEVYVDASALAGTVEREFRQAQYGLIALLGLLGLASAFVIRTNIRDRNRELGTLTRAHESMAKAEEEVVRLNEELEVRVQERTTELERANVQVHEAADGMKRLNEDLERRVEERTEQVTKANDQLYRLNESMTKLNESLEQRVAERTLELERANQAVQQLNEDLERRVEERTKELQTAQSELVRSERLATLGQLTATVSHELRNPLGAIRTAIYLIRGRTEGQGLGVESALERADRSITRCDNIINELLDFTRSTPLAPESAEFDDWLESVLAEQNLPPAITLQKEIGAGSTQILFDHDRLRRVVINVFNNACEAMTEGVESGQMTHAPMLRIQTHVNGDRLEMRFTDNGPGIPADVLARIFEPLYSTKSFGVGLGLPTVRQIMEQHGGGIDINSIQSQGTTVLLWLPTNRVDERAA